MGCEVFLTLLHMTNSGNQTPEPELWFKHILLLVQKARPCQKCEPCPQNYSASRYTNIHMQTLTVG